MATIDVKDAAGATVAIEKPLAPARAAAAASRPVVLSNEDFAVLDGLETAVAATNTKLDSLITAIGSTALNLGIDTGGTRTLRVAIDSAQAPAVGQATMAASTPVAIANNQSAIATAEQDGLTASGSVTSAATLFTQDMTGYKSVTVQVTSAGTTCTISYETSNDNTTWYGSTGIISTAVGNAAPVSSATVLGMWSFPKRGQFFRARVSAYGSGTVTVAATFNKTDVGVASTVNIGAFQAAASVPIAGVAAHNTAATASPIRMALSGHSTLPTLVGADARVVNWVGTLVGAAITKPFSIPENDWSYAAATGGITDTTAVTIKAAGAAGLRNYVIGIQYFNSAAMASEISIRDGAAGTVLWRGMVPASMTHPADHQFLSPLKGTAATLLEVVMGTTATATRFNAQGYVAP